MLGNKINSQQILDQYEKTIVKCTMDYVENSTRYCAVNVAGKSVYIENGTLKSENKKVIRKKCRSHQEACEEAVEIISGKIAEGYQRPRKEKEYKIDYSKAKDEEDKKEKEEEMIEGEPTDPIQSDIDEAYMEVLNESLQDLESRYGNKLSK
jgi:predicted DNA-binding WGR domain protein